jgi:glyoxylase-like metal-dependent hydrolase (beta-lactamase superfamily II)
MLKGMVVFNPCGLADARGARVEDNPWRPDSRGDRQGVSAIADLFLPTILPGIIETTLQPTPSRFAGPTTRETRMAESTTRFGARRPWLVALGFLLAAVVVLLGYRHYLADAPFSRDRVPRLGHAPLTVVPGVHMLGGLSPSAAYVIETSAGLVLVDSGLDADAGPLKSQMAKLGLDWKGVRAILLTHVHGDHTGGAESLRAATGAKVYAGAGDAPTLRAGQPREAFFSTFHMPGQALHPTTVDVTLQGGETLAFGDARVRAIATPGHTPGSICYLLERKSLRALFAGDVILMLRGDDKPRTELGKALGTYSTSLAPRYRGNARDYLASLRRLRALPVPDLVLPGHPGADVLPESPCLSQERWESLLDGGIRDMETLISRYETDGANFLDGNPKRLLPDLYYLGDLHGAAVYGLFASSKFFVVAKPSGAGLSEFLNDRVRQLGLDPKPPTAILLTSCDADDTAGLNELIEKSQCQVVASPEDLQRLKDSCPPGAVVTSAMDFPGKGWFPARPLPLKGRGVGPMAYQVAWGGKTVLFSGGLPVKLSQQAGERLIADLTTGRGDVNDAFESLDQLRANKPDLWLPAVPTDDQNANLYDSDWENIVKDNLALLRLIAAQRLRN